MNILTTRLFGRIVFLITFFTFIHQLHGQAPEQKISLRLNEVGLDTFIKAIEEKTNYSFIYGENIQLSNPVNLTVQNEPLKIVLQKAFENQPINFSFQNHHILLMVKQPSTQQTKQKYTISGYITDDISGETLIGANMVELTSRSGTAANEYGFYSITLPEGMTELRFSYTGYNSEIKKLNLKENTQLNIRLKPDVQLAEVIIYGDKPETGITATRMSTVDIPLSIIKSTPALLGEADIMKTIQMMPGVQAGTEGTAGIYVRGGGPDENLILLDGVPLYNVDHLFGFFSVFTPESVKKVSLYKGSFPARFGGRLSSVIDVRTNDGDMNNYHGSVGIGLLSSKFQLEGPILKNKTSFNISGRRSYIDLIAKPFMDDDTKFGYFFYDLNAKVNHRFNDRSRLFISLYTGRDKMDYEFKDDYGYDEEKYPELKYGKPGSTDRMDLHWGNLTSALKWNYRISPVLFSNTTVAFTEYKFKVKTRLKEQLTTGYSDYSSEYSSGIKDWTYNTDFDYYPLPKHHIKFGAGYLYHCFNPEVLVSGIKNRENENVSDTTYSGFSNTKQYAHEITGYIEDNFDIGSKLSMNAGLHFSLFHTTNKTYSSLQPRLSLQYKLNNSWAFKSAFTTMNQYIHLLSSYTITLPTDLWVPVTKRIKPMQSKQYSLGGYYTGLKGWELSAEAYYKDMHNVLEYKDGASFLGSSHNWEEKVELGKGRAFGIELMAQKTVGNTTGWLAYTWAKSERKFDKNGINEGKWFPYRYDRRHHINLTLSHKFSEKIDVGAAWEFYTGGTTTLAEEKTHVIRPEGGNPWWDNQTGEYIKHRNNYRMPSSHRLNLGINFHKKTKRGMRTWNVSVYNIYNAMNPTFLYKDTKENPESGSHKTILKKVTILPFVPSVSYIYKF